MSLIGSSVARTDGETKLRGEAIYGVDYAEAGMLHAKLLRSPVPAGVIRRLDVSAAAAAPGVRGVLTADDAPDCMAGMLVKDQTLFAKGVVRFEGEPIAAVVADTLEQAKAAVGLIELEIEATQAVGDIEAALADGAPLVHPAWEQYQAAPLEDHPRYGNVACETIFDPDGAAVDAAFAAADVIVEDEYRTLRQYQAYLEPKSAVAVYEQGRFVVHTAHQYPFNVRDLVAQFLGVRASDVRVVGHHIGGGFGAKLDVGLEPYAALLARHTGRPVKIVNERAEDMLTCPCRENAIIRMRSALAADGTILGRDIECLLDSGAASGESPYLVSLPVHVFGQVYKTGAARIVCKLLYTNTPGTGAFRGVSGTYSYFAQERHMDHCANRLGLDRREFRTRNLVVMGDVALNGQVIEEAGVLHEAFERVESVASWAQVTRQRPTQEGRLRGVGIAAAMWFTAPMAGSVTLKLNEDGTFGLITGANDNGSGAVSMGVTQIAAEQLGVRPEDIIVLLPDTDSAAWDGGSQGSRTTHVVGRATVKAATQVRESIFGVAAGLLEASEQDLELVDGAVRVKGAPTPSVSLSDVAAASMWTTGPITKTGSYASPFPAFNPGCASGFLFPALTTPTYHVHLAEVEVDPVTGQVTVLRYVVAQEVGKAINPDAVRGQIQGGVTQGLGYALYENIQIEHGRYRERSLEQYRLPLAVDIPTVETILLEHAEAHGPYGARGVAEAPIIPVAAAVANAVSDAIGTSVNRLPITPDDVLAALDRAPVRA